MPSSKQKLVCVARLFMKVRLFHAIKTSNLDNKWKVTLCVTYEVAPMQLFCSNIIYSSQLLIRLEYVWVT